MQRHARFEPFLECRFQLKDLNHQDHQTNRLITPLEIAFVACRITTSVLSNKGFTDKVSFGVFLNQWRQDYVKFTDKAPSHFKMKCIVKVLEKYDIVRKENRCKATPIYSLGHNNPYRDPNYTYTPPQEHKYRKTPETKPAALSLSDKKATLEGEIEKEKAKLMAYLN